MKENVDGRWFILDGTAAIHPPISPSHLRPLYIALVFISVHKFEGSYTYAPAQAHPKYISSDQNIWDAYYPSWITEFSSGRKDRERIKNLYEINKEKLHNVIMNLSETRCYYGYHKRETNCSLRSLRD